MLKHILALAIAGLTALSTLPAYASGPRVVVILKAKPGSEQKLLEDTKKWMVDVRKVPGLEHVDINVVNGDPSTLVLYYEWRSKDDEDAYRQSDLYKRAIAALEPLVAERQLIRATNAD